MRVNSRQIQAIHETTVVAFGYRACTTVVIRPESNWLHLKHIYKSHFAYFYIQISQRLQAKNVLHRPATATVDGPN